VEKTFISLYGAKRHPLGCVFLSIFYFLKTL
jgi:hypothetical protein